MKGEILSHLSAIQESISGGFLRRSLLDRIKSRLRGAEITVAALTTISFNILHTHTIVRCLTEEEKNLLRSVAEIQYSEDFLELRPEQQYSQIASCMTTLCSMMMEELKDRLDSEEEEYIDTYLRYLEILCDAIKDTELLRHIEEIHRMVKNADASQDSVIGQLKDDALNQALVQEIGGKRYLTYSTASDDFMLAQKKAIAGINEDIEKYSLKEMKRLEKTRRENTRIVVTEAYELE